MGDHQIIVPPLGRISHAAFLGLALLVALAFQGSRGLYETTEGRYAEVAREMVRTGRFLEPTLNHQPHYTKPPLTYWAIAGGIKLWGANEWGVRFFNGIAFLLTAVAVGALGTNLFGRPVGWIAAMIYITSPFPAFAKNAVCTDTLLTLWETSAVCAYVYAIRRPPARQWRWSVALWVFCGLAFATKGPPALLCLLPMILFQFRPRRMAWRTFFHPLALASFALIGLSWYVVLARRHPGLASYWLTDEVVGRIATDEYHRNPQWYKPFILYLPSIALGGGIWTVFGIKLIRSRKLWHPATVRAYLKRDDRAAFLFFWLVIPLVVFFVVQSRLVLYVLPLYVPVSLVLAYAVYRCASNWRRTTLVTTSVSALILVVLLGAGAFLPNRNDMRALYQLCRPFNRPDTVFYAVNEPKLYGLQFYLGDRLQRISLLDHPAWADASFDDAARTIKTTCLSRKYVVLVRGRCVALVKERLAAAGIPFESRASRFWTVIPLCLPAPAAGPEIAATPTADD